MMTPRNYAQEASPTENKTQSEKDAKHQRIASGIIDDPQYAEFGIYEQTAARPESATPIITRLPLELPKDARIALIGNTLLDRSLHFGNIESLIYQRYPEHQLVIRNLSWSGDTVDLRPRPDNFADIFQHLYHEKTDVILAAFGCCF